MNEERFTIHDDPTARPWGPGSLRSEHEWLTVEELAERYRRSAHTIRRWLRDGKFGAAAEKTPAGGWLVRADAGKPVDGNRDQRF